MREKDVQVLVTKRLREIGAFTHKISDMSLGYKPFDFFGVYRGTCFYIELKIMKRGKSFPFSNIRTNQISALRKIEANAPGFVLGGVAVAMIDDKGKVEKIAMIETSELISRLHEGKKSISKDDLYKMDDLLESITTCRTVAQ